MSRDGELTVLRRRPKRSELKTWSIVYRAPDGREVVLADGVWEHGHAEVMARALASAEGLRFVPAPQVEEQF